MFITCCKGESVPTWGSAVIHRACQTHSVQSEPAHASKNVCLLKGIQRGLTISLQSPTNLAELLSFNLPLCSYLIPHLALHARSPYWKGEAYSSVKRVQWMLHERVLGIWALWTAKIASWGCECLLELPPFDCLPLWRRGHVRRTGHGAWEQGMCEA